ncbi:MAG: single-stranded-DNA-specific exonuclease RecJ [Clostridiaceae bacterium]
MKVKWTMRGSEAAKGISSEKLGISPQVAAILANRGIVTAEGAEGFLHGSLEDLHDGVLMKDMDKGIRIIKDAILNKVPVLIYGDYDCDGVSSVYVLLKGLKECGAEVSYHIPHRENEGYGMNLDRIKKLYEEGYKVIITCDNGISAFEEIAYAKSLGMTVVVTDHHDVPFSRNDEVGVEEKLPDADAVINPKQKDCGYPFKALCGAGVAYKFISVLAEEMNVPLYKIQPLIEVVAIATVCDVVDLLEENRIIVKEGLKRLNNTKNAGIKALIKENNLQDKKISEYHLGFILGPCINATGRLETADIALDLLMCQDEKEAETSAKRLVQINKERQEMTNESLEKVLNTIKTQGCEKDKVIVIYEPSVHESLAGIVAGRVREKYNVPAIIMTSGKDMPKGSGRSTEKYNMYNELSKCKELISKFGGHPMAAGLSVKEENLQALREALLANCNLTEEDLIPEIKIDARLEFEKLNYTLMDELEELAPFGKGNPKPLFGEKQVTIKRIWFIGADKNSVRVSFSYGNNKMITGVAFNFGNELRESMIELMGEEEAARIEAGNYCSIKCAIVYYPNINEYNNTKSIQVKIESIKLMK